MEGSSPKQNDFLPQSQRYALKSEQQFHEHAFCFVLTSSMVITFLASSANYMVPSVLYGLIRSTILYYQYVPTYSDFSMIVTMVTYAHHTKLVAACVMFYCCTKNYKRYKILQRLGWIFYG